MTASSCLSGCDTFGPHYFWPDFLGPRHLCHTQLGQRNIWVTPIWAKHPFGPLSFGPHTHLGSTHLGQSHIGAIPIWATDIWTTHIQFPNMNTDRLLNKPYQNGISLTEQNLSLKYYQSLKQSVFNNQVKTVPKRYCGSL